MFKIAVIFVAVLVVYVNSHGRMMRPVNRSSVWRLPEFAHLNPPINWNDDELNCGAAHENRTLGVDCGACGDIFTDPIPRPNEIGGKWYRGIITGRYSAGSVIDIDVELTQYHGGFFEIRLCTNPQGAETQNCFKQNELQRADGGGSKFPADAGNGWYFMQYRLPAGVTCQQCVLQWHYSGGGGANSSAECEDGYDAYGCDLLETFAGCADITIT